MEILIRKLNYFAVKEKITLTATETHRKNEYVLNQ